MGKKSRRTKAKTKDFQKVKLKVGKRKPAANNVTETSFKSQSIYIPEQLKNASLDEISENGNLTTSNVLDLLNQTGHFNANVRTDALTSLKVQLSNNKDIIPAHLQKIMQKIPRLLVDADRQVRRSCIALFRLLFTALTETQISPFFELILSNLYCAMSHIYDDVQKDSLQLIDILLEFYPGLVSKQNKDSLLLHFIEMISSKQTSSAADSRNGNDTGTVRVLSMKLSSKETSSTWRVKVLNRLHALLHATERRYEEKDPTEEIAKSNFGDKFVFDSQNGVILPWDSPDIEEVMTCFNSRALTKKEITLRSNSVGIFSTLTTEGQMSSPWQLITTLFPLLFDCWHEVISDESKSIDSEGIATMMHVLDIVLLLTKNFIGCADNKSKAIVQLRADFLPKFEQYFITTFPFHHLGGSGRGKRKRDQDKKQILNNNQEGIQKINLSVCELVTSIVLESEVERDAPILTSVATYIASLLLETQKVTNQCNLKKILSTVRQLMELASDPGTMENILHPLLLFYLGLTESHPLKKDILGFFLHLYSKTSGENHSMQDSPVMVEWACSLPDLLITFLRSRSKLKGQEGKCLNSDISKDNILPLLLSCLRLAGLQKNKEFIETMEERSTLLLSVLCETADDLFCHPKIEQRDRGSVPCQDCMELQARVFEMLIHNVPCLSEENFSLLARLCHQGVVSPRNVHYVSELVFRSASQSPNSDGNQILLTMYKFLGSILFGASREELSDCQKASDDMQINGHHQIIHFSSENTPEFIRHQEIVLKFLLMIKSDDHLPMVISVLLCDKLLINYKILPAKVVFAILESGKMLLQIHSLPGQLNKKLLSAMSSLCISCLLEIFRNKDEMDEKIFRILMEQVMSILKEFPDIFHGSLQYISESDFSCTRYSSSACQVFDKLMMTPGMIEDFKFWSDTVGAVLDRIKVELPEAAEMDWFKFTQNNFEIFVKNRGNKT